MDTYQNHIAAWMLECFTLEIAADQVERGDRFVEEALELAQTIPGWSLERAIALAFYVFGRPVGEPDQEVGGAMVTLAALCNALGIDMTVAKLHELDRISQPEVLAKIRAKQAAKPTGSALPGHANLPETSLEARLMANAALQLEWDRWELHGPAPAALLHKDTAELLYTAAAQLQAPARPDREKPRAVTQVPASDLDACPSCSAGNVFLRQPHHDARHHVECSMCGMRGPTQMGQDSACRSWNALRRPTDVAQCAATSVAPAISFDILALFPVYGHGPIDKAAYRRALTALKTAIEEQHAAPLATLK